MTGAGAPRFRRRFGPWRWPALLGLAALVVVYGRFVAQARHAVRAAAEAAARGDGAEANRCYLDALRAYVPGSPYERRALDGLQAAATAARARGDAAAERAAWEAVRVGLLSTRSLYLPYATRFTAATGRLAELDAAAAFPGHPGAVPELAIVSARGNGPGRSVRPFGPAVLATLVSFGGFAVWIGALLLLIRQGLQREARGARSRPAPPGGGVGRALLPVLCVAGFALFLLGMRLP